MSQDGKIALAALKVPLYLLPLRALQGVARVFGYGAKKYAKGNWALATDDDAAERYAGAILRHLEGMQNPNGTFTGYSASQADPESGLPHLDHLLASAIMLRGILQTRRYPTAVPFLAEDPGPGRAPPGAIALTYGTRATQTSVPARAVSVDPLDGYTDDNKQDAARAAGGTVFLEEVPK
jgi:hypothetical protein